MPELTRNEASERAEHYQELADAYRIIARALSGKASNGKMEPERRRTQKEHSGEWVSTDPFPERSAHRKEYVEAAHRVLATSKKRRMTSSEIFQELTKEEFPFKTAKQPSKSFGISLSTASTYNEIGRDNKGRYYI